MKEIENYIKELEEEFRFEVNNDATRREFINKLKNNLNIDRINYKEIYDITSDIDINKGNIRFKVIDKKDNEQIFLLNYQLR